MFDLVIGAAEAKRLAFESSPESPSVRYWLAHLQADSRIREACAKGKCSVRLSGVPAIAVSIVSSYFVAAGYTVVSTQNESAFDVFLRW